MVTFLFQDNDILADKLAECQGHNSKLEYDNKELAQRIGEQRQEITQERDVNAAVSMNYNLSYQSEIFKSSI